MTDTTTPVAAPAADFAPFAEAINTRFAELSTGELYVVDLDDTLFEKYLAAFPAGTDLLFRKRTVHDCSTCKRFVRNLGKVVAIDEGKVLTVWDVPGLEHPYAAVAAAMDALVKAAPIKSVFRTKEGAYGGPHNYDPVSGQRYDHFRGVVAGTHKCADPGAKVGEKAAAFQVLGRGLREIRDADLRTVVELIDANSLYRGQEHRHAVMGFMGLRDRFKAAGLTDLFVWDNLDDPHARFRNTVIGTLLVDLAEGKDLDRAVREFETKVAPANYKRPTSVITEKMVEDAVRTLTDLGLHGAVARRYARMSDVSVNDVLFVDNDTRAVMKDGHAITALLAGSVKKAAPDLKHAVEVAADDFVRDVLPGTSSLEAYVENRHLGNFVSLTGGDGPERLFKWDNNFAWAYDGDVTDSVKARVKAAGGNINALLRVSLSWFNYDDLDLHCATPRGDHIYYGDKRGVLDVDMNAGGEKSRTPVENLAFSSLPDGTYRVYVHQFNRRETTDFGFAIEYEFGGQVHQYRHPRAMQTGENVECFKIHVTAGAVTKVETALAGGTASQEKWGVKTETLVPVAAVMYSPNHWNGSAVGARHLILALKGCVNPGQARGIFNEHLRPEFEKHRKVMEVLGAKTKVAPLGDQISGIGFTAARGDSVAVVVDGKRAYRLKF